MKKQFLTLSLAFPFFSCILLIMSCGYVGLGGYPKITPKNIFNGGTWARKYTYYEGTDDEFIYIDQLYKFSFTENEFTCTYQDNTYTGTYKLSYEDGWLFITLTSSDSSPRVNGKVQYMPLGIFSPLEDFSTDELQFYPYWNDPNKGNILLGGLFKKM